MKTFIASILFALAVTTAAAAQACPDGQSRVCDATEDRCTDQTVCDEWGKDGTCNHYQTVRSCTPVCVHWSCS